MAQKENKTNKSQRPLTVLEQVKHLDKWLLKFITSENPKVYEKLEEFTDKISNELYIHPLFKPKLFISIIALIEHSPEEKLASVYHAMMKLFFRGEPLNNFLIGPLAFWFFIRLFIKYLDDANKLWIKSPNALFTVKYIDENTSTETELLKLDSKKKHFYARNLILLIVVMHKVINITPLTVLEIDSDRIAPPDVLAHLNKVITQTAKLMNPPESLNQNKQKDMTEEEELTVIQSAIFALIALKRYTLSSLDDTFPYQIRKEINNLTEVLSSMANQRAAYGFFENKNYTQLTVIQAYRFQLSILSQMMLDVTWGNDPCYLKTDENKIHTISYGNWALGTEEWCSIFYPRYPSEERLFNHPYNDVYYAEILVLTPGNFSIGVYETNGYWSYDAKLYVPEMKMVWNSSTFISTNLSDDQSLVKHNQPLLLGVLVDTKESDSIKVITFYVNGVKVIPNEAEIMPHREMITEMGFFEGQDPIEWSPFSLHINLDNFEQVVFLRKSSQWQFPQLATNAVQFPLPENYAHIERLLESSLGKTLTWPLEEEYISRHIFKFLNPESLYVARHVSTLFALYAREAAQKVTKLTLISDKDAALQIYGNNDAIGPYFYTNDDGSSFLSTGNLAKSQAEKSFFSFSNNLYRVDLQEFVNYFPNVKELTFSQRDKYSSYFWPLIELLKHWSRQLTTLKLYLNTEGESIFHSDQEVRHISDFEDPDFGENIKNLISSFNNLPELRSVTLKMGLPIGYINNADFEFISRLEEFHFVGVPVLQMEHACRNFLWTAPNPPLRRFSLFCNRYDENENYHFYFLENMFLLPKSVIDEHGAEVLTRAHTGTIFPLLTSVEIDSHNIDTMRSFLRKEPSLELLDMSFIKSLPSLGALTDLLSSYGPNVRFIHDLLVGKHFPKFTSSSPGIVPIPSVKGLRVILSTKGHGRLCLILAELKTAFPELNCLRILDARSKCTKCKARRVEFTKESSFDNRLKKLAIDSRSRVVVDVNYGQFNQRVVPFSCFLDFIKSLMVMYPKTKIIYEMK